jgi:ribonuclease PH
MRDLTLTPGFIDYPEGSVLIQMGGTRVLCNASVEHQVPPWMVGSGRGWVTAEYALLPRSTHTRSRRESVAGKIGGRTHEISRLIGRSLRAGFALDLLGERMVTVDCDVLQADGGTRTAAITGGYLAAAIAMRGLVDADLVPPDVIRRSIAAISVGIVEGQAYLDLCYEEDSRADSDVNVVMSGDGRLIEIQGTAEKEPFGRSQLDDLLDLASLGIADLIGEQERVLRQVTGWLGSQAE